MHGLLLSLLDVGSGGDVVRTKVEGAKAVDGDATVKAELVATDGDDVVSVLVFAHCEGRGSKREGRTGASDGGRCRESILPTRLEFKPRGLLGFSRHG